jgi:hypothetical protein
MQRKAAAELAEKVRAEGWSEVVERDDRTSDEFYAKYAEAVGDTIKKAERAKFAATVYYHSRSGEVIVTATYSPEDNKLRLYATSRLDADLYARAKAAGFAWVPRQQLFVALMWTPEREDLLIELAGTIGDEDKTKLPRSQRGDRRACQQQQVHAGDRPQVSIREAADQVINDGLYHPGEFIRTLVAMP